MITLGHGSEFTCRHFDARACQRGIRLDFIRPGRAAESAFIASFNGRLRDECLNAHWLASVDETHRTLKDWRRDYNETRPHSFLADLVPSQYLAQLLDLKPAAALEG